MKKKVLALLLAAAMTCSLAGCGGSSGNGESASGDMASDEAGEEQDEASEESSGTENEAGAETAEGSGKEQDFSGITLTIMSTNENTFDGIDAVIAAAEEKFGFTVEYDITGSGGEDYNNLVRSRLASGDMDDMIIYNSGALFKQLNPKEYFMDFSGNPAIMDRLDESFAEVVSVDGATYGVPYSSSNAGGILYNKATYKELGLEIPHTWDDFLANCKAVQEAGQTPIMCAFGDGWPGIVTQFGDYYNVHAENPNFAQELDAGTTKWATTPAGIKSYQKVIDVAPYCNEDYMSTGYADACDRFAQGEGVHWIILTNVLSNLYSLYGNEVTDNIGVFGIPGDDPDNHGLTVWMPSAIYANKDTEHEEAVRAFIEFYVSEEALDLYSSKVLPDGPYCIKGYEIPDNAFPAVREDMQSYFDAGKTWSALEFSSSLEAADSIGVLQQLALGEITAEEGAAAIDKSLESYAIQLGLEWN